MVRLKYLYVVAALFAVSSVSAQNAERQLAFDNYHRYFEEAQRTSLDAEKEKGLKHFRDFYAVTPYRGHELKRVMPLSDILANWQDDGHFVDLEEREQQVMAGKDQGAIGELLSDAFFRIWKVAEEFRTDRMGFSLDKKVFKKCQKAILHYGNLEVSRSNRVHRFHASCFAIPTAAVNTYFCFLKQMDKVETGKNKDRELADVCDMLKVLGLQAWTQPLRHDETDKNVVQIERFRQHVWWVGGNALAYRVIASGSGDVSVGTDD